MNKTAYFKMAKTWAWVGFSVACTATFQHILSNKLSHNSFVPQYCEAQGFSIDNSAQACTLLLCVNSKDMFCHVLQLQHDYLLGNYPVGRDDAAQLAALQIFVEIGFMESPETLVYEGETLLADSYISFLNEHAFYHGLPISLAAHVLTGLSACFVFREWPTLLDRFLPKPVAMTRARRDWDGDILMRYHALVKVYAC